MKREELPNSSPWQSQAEAAALLDSLDAVMWDELDAIRGASPIQSPAAAAQVRTLQSGGGASPIRGEDQERQLSSGGPFAMSAAFWAASGSVSMPVVASRTPASTWANVESELVLQCNDLPNASAMERRRQKNRDCMRRARQRQRQQLNDMKETVATLEKQYADLSLTSSQRRVAHLAPPGQRGTLVANKMASDVDEAAELTRRLGAENLFLKAEIQQQAAWKSALARVLQSTMEVDGPRWAQQFQQPSLGGDAVLRMRLDERDQLEAAEEFGFHPLTDFGLTQVILENSRTISRAQSRLLVPSSFDTDDGARTRRMQSFGWDMVQRVHGNIMECVFTKKFRGLNVAQLMQKTWANDMRLGEFRKVKGETSRLEVLQQVNPNAYVLVRDVTSPTEDIATFRSVFVRFLIETSKRIPVSKATFAPTCIDASAPSTPPQYADSDSDSDELLLEATGFVLGTQSCDTDYSRNPREEDVRKKVAWAHLSLSIEFLNVMNPVTGDEYQQLRWSGRTDYCGPEHAQRNASDMLQGMLRWELLVIAPALNLFSLSIE
ncbi:hypothetical protein PHYPSEUDO_010113 [Phytophthora pseudosyringae]|uniref:BZIP domain-containing protein n=1 Tax=Phytophthora pseudosyringae TaxID=221518 RepID=A0A8T1VDZ0_9STRA|nr:hypothetical protein PHYPSEUDO_010113 [Phytophthora pseudosyringae]